MFGLGFSEILILGVIAFLVFGPERFPRIVREFVKFFNELKQGFSEIKTEIHSIETKAKKQIHQVTDDIKKDLASLEAGGAEALDKEAGPKERQQSDHTGQTAENSEKPIPGKK